MHIPQGMKSIMQSNKKGIYFTVEAVFSLMVISIGFGIILYLFVVLSKPPVGIVQTELYDTADLFMVKIQDISQGNCSINSTAVEEGDGNITDISNTLFQQLGEYYFRWAVQDCDYCDDLLSTCIADYVSYRNLDDVNVDLRIEGTSFYTNNATLAQENATVLFPYKTILFGTVNNTHMWGPYIGEIRIWQ